MLDKFRVIAVASGRAVFFRAQDVDTVAARNLTLCSAALLRGVDKHNQTVGYMMLHRGGQGNDYFQEEIRKAAHEAGDGVTWYAEAIQHASGTSLENHRSPDDWGGSISTQSDTLHALIEDIHDTVPISTSKMDMHSMAKVGSYENMVARQMVVNSMKDGRVAVQKPKGMFTECAIM